MHQFDSESLRWKRIKSNSQNPTNVSGRKNFAMSYCCDQIFLTGGMDNGQNLIQDFSIMQPSTGNWTELKQARPRKDDKSLKRKTEQSPSKNNSGVATRNASLKDLSLTAG